MGNGLVRSSLLFVAFVLTACVASTPASEPAPQPAVAVESPAPPPPARASSAPTATASSAPVTSSERGLEPEAIRRVVLARYESFQACAALDETVSGTTSILFSVAADGHVDSVSVGESLGNPRVEGCLLGIFQRLEFPSAAKPTKASFPFLFKPKQKEKP
jgi:outer membrane biosynthesis protein TonB